MTVETTRSIQDIRGDIDIVDDEINVLLARRAFLALEMKIAKGDDVQIYQPEREEEILSRVASQHSGPLSEVAVRGIFAAIIQPCRELQIPKY